MQMHVCTYSTQVSAFGYEPKTQEFAVRFRASGETYLYKGVPADVFDAFMHAHSKGSFVHHHVKGKFDYELA